MLTTINEKLNLGVGGDRYMDTMRRMKRCESFTAQKITRKRFPQTVGSSAIATLISIRFDTPYMPLIRLYNNSKFYQQAENHAGNHSDDTNGHRRIKNEPVTTNRHIITKITFTVIHNKPANISDW